MIMEDIKKYNLNHLRELEAESIYVLREVAAQFERPALLFSGGKDSIVMYHLARKAFWPQVVPFPCLHIDTGHNFPETLVFRDKLMDRSLLKVKTQTVQKAVNSHKKHEETQKDDMSAFEYVCRCLRAFLCLFVAIPGVRFSVPITSYPTPNAG